MPKYSKAELDAIEQADAERRLVREVAELQAIATRTVDPYHWSRAITGEPSAKNRNHRASDDCWKLGLSNPRLGYTRTLVTETILPNTVKHTVNGETRVVPSSKFRKERIHTKQRNHRIEAVDRANAERHVKMAGNMPSLMQGQD